MAGAGVLASWIEEWMFGEEPGDWAVIAPTFGDARDTCMEGPSGLLRALGGEHGGLVRTWNRSLGELVLPNGTKVFCDGADDGALRIQGKNLRGVWGDEVGLWRRWDTAWNESIYFAVRFAPGRIVATGTPKQGHRLVGRLLADDRVAKSHMRTVDNIANLDRAAVEELQRRYADTRLGRQELEGEYIEEVEGTLWTLEVISGSRVHADNVPDLARVAVAVDPSGGDEEGNDEQGIVVVGRGVDGHGYVLADRSCKLSPDGWGKRAVRAYDEFDADVMVGEANYGGDLVVSNIKVAARDMGVTVNVKKITASRGKVARAEPVAALYEQGRVHHVGEFPELEAQQRLWTQESGWSPDRVDALVFALTEVLVDRVGGRGTVSATRARIPGVDGPRLGIVR